MTTPFYKLSGAGNDFLALVEPAAAPGAEEIAAWCRRGVSLGADGLFVLARRADGAVGMDYFNADGHPAALCLNGTRCAARLAFELGWARERVRIHTGAGEVIAEDGASDRGEEIALQAPLPQGTATPQQIELQPTGAGAVTVLGHRLVVGVPHFVLEWPGGVADAPVASAGPAIRRHPAFAPDGTNVHFVAFHGDHFDIRSFERGVEAETLACGTGVLAASAVGLVLGRCALPVRALTRGGFVLRVEGRASGRSVESWRLVGDARVVARGELLPAAAAIATTPAW